MIGLYAALCRDEGRRFSYPGGPSYVAEALDCRLLADALVWAATTAAAWGEHFNITNGEVFEWRDLWPTLAERRETAPGGLAWDVAVELERPPQMWSLRRKHEA